MDRVVRLYQLWSWLPHFRVVAETEHLPSASEALGLSPSALSRALKQLEAAVGRQLFERDRSSIRLNAYGTELLRAVRQAMRGIDDALTSMADDDLPKVLRVSAPGPFHSAMLLEMGTELMEAFPRLKVELASCSDTEIAAKLCQGVLDLCVHESPVSHDELETTQIAVLPKVIACGPDHPLASSSTVVESDLRAHAFAAPPPGQRGVREDGWPAELERQVALTVGHMQTGIDACLSDRYLAVLPQAIAVANGLVSLFVEGVELPSAPLFVTTRQSIGPQAPEITQLLESLRARLDT